MPVKRTLNLEEKENTPAKKRRVPERTYSPVTGTRFTSPAPSKGHSEASGKTDNPSEVQKPQTDAEKLRALRSKMERSVEAFKKAREQLKIVPTEGSSELETFFFRGSADLQTELCRNRELVAKVETHSKGKGVQYYHFQGVVKPGSSYEFLKSILN
ncbi:hypothetical protein AAFF_G00074290 [Aldrovandia affinis]|uniref:Uncharacterized protein n=1 Tax=Aldrovandia affinis TaxID=143900 RepID=A0AAD7RY54_9TELE|nr:hypothetical protein AAFF_G00074290 [Aldrovandia affinis]